MQSKDPLTCLVGRASAAAQLRSLDQFVPADESRTDIGFLLAAASPESWFQTRHSNGRSGPQLWASVRQGLRCPPVCFLKTPQAFADIGHGVRVLVAVLRPTPPRCRNGRHRMPCNARSGDQPTRDTLPNSQFRPCVSLRYSRGLSGAKVQ
jgi:hypothetical protein